MANSFNKEERVAFEQILEGFQDALVLSRNVNVYRTSAQGMERSNNTIWRPMPYIARSYPGTDQTANFNPSTQLAVPASINIPRSSPWTMDANELNDALQENRLGEAASEKLGSDINEAVMDVAADQGTMVVKRTSAASGFDDVAQCEAVMNEQGVKGRDRYLALSTRDYNGMADNLAARTLGNSRKSLTAYEDAYVGRVSSFETYKLDYANRLTAAVGTGVTINGASQFYVPLATSTATTGQQSNVDNRYQDIAITVTGGTVKIGDAFTLVDVNAVQHITKKDTGQLKTFRITAIVSGAGGTGTIQISPPIISNEGGSNSEGQYQNVTATPSDGATFVFLNTADAAVNPFWFKPAIEILPGRFAVPTDAGAGVMRSSTDQGFEVVMQKQYDIDNMITKYRLDVFFGVTMCNPEMAGIMLFDQV